MATSRNCARLPISRAFTLLELLVAMALLTVLLGLGAGAVQKARDASARSECQNRLRNQGLAVFHYESREGHLPPGSISGPYTKLNVPEGVNHGLWTVLLADLGEPATDYHWDLSFDHSDNQPAVNRDLPVLRCPRQLDDRVEQWPDGKTGRVCDYAGIAGSAFLADIGLIDPSSNFETALPVNGAVRMADISDGTANTLLLVEAAGRPGAAWSSPDSLISVRSILGGTAHRGGANVIFCDGSVRFFSSDTELKVLGRLSTRNGGE